jgi:Tol biopolymer transport system component
MPIDGGEETKILGEVLPCGGFTLGKEGIYFCTAPDKQGHKDLSIYDFATGKTRKILTIERQLGLGLAVSPDDRTILYSQLDEAGSDLMLVENFR